MKSVTVKIKGQDHTLAYDIEETTAGKMFTVIDLSEELNLGAELKFRAWEEMNVFENRPTKTDDAGHNHDIIIKAVYKAENIKFES